MKTTSYFADGDDVIERTTMDVEPFLEDAKRRHNAGLFGSSELKHAARYSPVDFEAYCKRVGITWHEFMSDRKHIKSMLNDPDLRSYRIWPGKV